MPNEPPYTEQIDPNLEDQDVAFAHIKEVISQWLLLAQLEGQAPMVSASNLFSVLLGAILEAMPATAARMGLLMAFENSYPQGLSYKERQDVVDMLSRIAQARASVEGRGALILPGKPDA